MIRTKLKEQFDKNEAEGKNIRLSQWIDDNSLKIKVTGKSSDDKKATLLAMEEKASNGKLVTLPTPSNSYTARHDALKITVSNREKSQGTRIAFSNNLGSMLKRNASIPSDATKEEIEKLLDKAVTKAKLRTAWNEVMGYKINGKTIRSHAQIMHPDLLDVYFKNVDTSNKIINSQIEMDLVDTFIDIHNMELKAENKLAGLLSSFPMWTDCLSQVSGVGPVIGATLIAKIDIFKTNSPGSLIRFFGLTVEDDGKGTSKRREHNVPMEFINSKGELAYKWGTGYDPQKQSFAISKIGDSFKKRGSANPYGIAYRQKKKQYALAERFGIKDAKSKGGLLRDKEGRHVPNKGHIDKAAIRWMCKIFLIDLWLFWAAFEGVPIKASYYARYINPLHNGRNEWDLMVSRLGNPLDLRYQVYGERDPIPECYTKTVVKHAA